MRVRCGCGLVNPLKTHPLFYWFIFLPRLVQELEVVVGDEHISFTTTKIGSLVDVEKSKDPEGLRAFYYLVQDLKCFVISIMSLHFKIKPTPT